MSIPLRRRPLNSLWWCPTPRETDGGAIVTQYLLSMMNYLDPLHNFHIIPKVPEELDAKELPFANFYSIKTEWGKIPMQISELMIEKHIPVMTMFHIPWEFFPIVESIHDIGGIVINHQTIHWEDDVLFQSNKLNDIDYWVAPTEFAKRALATKGRVNSSLIKVIPHGVNLEYFYPHKAIIRESLGIKDDETVITWIGRCQLTKGAHVIIPILHKLLEEFPKVHFIARAGVYGGVHKSFEIGYILERMAKRNPRLHFIPDWTPTSFMEDLMAATDIGLCVSGHEGFSLPPLEWMACGKPVALSAIPSHIELMGGKNHFYGMLMETSISSELVNVYPSNPDGTMVKVPKPDLIYDTLKFMLENPDECKTMGKNGFNRARENYNLAKIASEWLDFLELIVPEGYDMDAKMEEKLLTL